MKTFQIILSSVAALGFNSSMLGKLITDKDVDRLVVLNKKYKINIAGEGGEFESLVLSCPLFKKKIKIVESETIMENEYTGNYIIKKATLI